MMVDVRVPCVCVFGLSVRHYLFLFIARVFHAVACELFHCTPLASRVCRPPAAAATLPPHTHTFGGALSQVGVGSDNPTAAEVPGAS